MRKILIREKLRQNKPVIGTWSNIPSPVVADILASAGLDFIIIDREHGFMNFETAMQVVIACEANGVSPAIRLGSIHQEEMQRALDIGAHCIHIPSISTLQQAKQCVEIFKYPPLGQRGFSPFTRAGEYGSLSSKEIFAHANKEPMLAIHIEDMQGVQALEEILQVDGIDIIFLGLFDLSKSLGIPGEITHPKLLALLEKLTRMILSAGKHPGTIATTKEQLQQGLDYGMQYITYSVDCCMLKNTYKEIVQWNSVWQTKEPSSQAAPRELAKPLL